jgi:hypothetical protein
MATSRKLVENEDSVDDVEEIDEVLPYSYAITSYGADYPVDALVKRIQEGSILIPDFQRKYVWKQPQASRFVESLLLGLPVPGVFLEKEPGKQKLLIIDGQQRLLSLFYFYEGVFEPTDRKFALSGVQEQFEGLTYKTLPEDDRRRLDDAIIHATVVRQDEPTDDRSSIYHVFERLNTGGTPLSAQEIRTCVYHGQLCDLLNELNDHESWREIYGKASARMKDQELILRFFALAHDLESYARPMKGFLNDFMEKHRELDGGLTAKALSREFKNCIDSVHKAIGKKAFRPVSSLNAAVFDAVMIGISSRLVSGTIEDLEKLKIEYDSLLKDKEFVESYKKSTADEASVKRRIQLAIDAFADVS